MHFNNVHMIVLLKGDALCEGCVLYVETSGVVVVVVVSVVVVSISQTQQQ